VDLSDLADLISPGWAGTVARQPGLGYAAIAALLVLAIVAVRAYSAERRAIRRDARRAEKRERRLLKAVPAFRRHDAGEGL
jgi:hypothetical protein